MKSFHCLSALLFLASASTFAGQVKTETEAIKLATGAIHKYHLTTLKDECGAIDVIDQSTYFELVVRERHTRDCGGTPETGPRLFNVRVNKRDGRLTTDAYDGTNFRPLDHKPASVKQGAVFHRQLTTADAQESPRLGDAGPAGSC